MVHLTLLTFLTWILLKIHKNLFLQSFLWLLWGHVPSSSVHRQFVEKQFVNIQGSSSKVCPQCLIRSHVLPGFIHWLNVLFGLHPECCDAGTPVIFNRVFIIEAGRALVGRSAHWLHTLDHARWGVEEAVAWIGRLQALRWTHEPWDGMHGCGTRDGWGQPGI